MRKFILGVLIGAFIANGIYYFRKKENVVTQPAQPQQPAQQQPFQPRQQPQRSAQAAQSLAITTASPLRRGRERERYDVRMQATGGTRPYNWEAADLPRGLRIDRRSGRITGTPRENGMFHSVITVEDDSSGATFSRTFVLEIRANPRDPFEFDSRWFIWPLGIIGTVIIAILAVILIVKLANWVMDEFDDNGGSNIGISTSNGNGGNGKIDTGGLKVNNNPILQNGIRSGEVVNVPAGYLVIGDVSVNGQGPDSDATTGQIAILHKGAQITGVNPASVIPFGPDVNQTLEIQKQQMRNSGCSGGCKSIQIITVR